MEDMADRYSREMDTNRDTEMVTAILKVVVLLCFDLVFLIKFLES